MDYEKEFEKLTMLRDQRDAEGFQKTLDALLDRAVACPVPDEAEFRDDLKAIVQLEKVREDLPDLLKITHVLRRILNNSFEDEAFRPPISNPKWIAFCRHIRPFVSVFLV